MVNSRKMRVYISKNLPNQNKLVMEMSFQSMKKKE